MTRPRRPLVAAYRIQLEADLDLDAVTDLVPYLTDLGISHVSLSSALTARTGSTHSNGQVDPTTVLEALGGEAALRRLARTGVGIILDIAPGPMGIGEQNPSWTRPEVFDRAHGKVVELVADGIVDGVRVERLDELADPRGYLDRLADAGVGPVWVDEILGPDDELPDWPVAGTVGYRFLNQASGVFVDPAGEEAFTDLWREISSEDRGFSQVADEPRAEDTTLHHDVRALVLDEVGSDPDRFGTSVDRFHIANATRARRSPLGLLETSTRDTKRSADVRARLATLTGRADWWRARVTAWMERTDALVTDGAPDSVERYYIFQTLIGAWPIDGDRLAAHLRRAMREARRTTSGVSPDATHEAAVEGFCRRVLEHEPFLEDFVPSACAVASDAMAVSLGQVLLKLTSPGVPEIYQGDELPELRLADPDDRRPVDWSRRRRALAEIATGAPPTSETAKLALTHLTLALRRRRLDVFSGDYRPLRMGAGVCAFTRGDDRVLVVVPLREGERDRPIEIPHAEEQWRDVLAGVPVTGAPERVGDVVGTWGVGLWERVGPAR